MDDHLANHLRDAIASHFGWQLHMKSALQSGNSHTTSEEAARCDLCDFGKWLGDPQIVHDHGESVQYRVINRLHREFHQCAGEIIHKIEAGFLSDAQAMVATDFVPRSDHLIAGLTKWIREARRGEAA